MMDIGICEEVFNGFFNLFYVVDFRDWQVVQLNFRCIEEIGVEILVLEKIRFYVLLE